MRTFAAVIAFTLGLTAAAQAQSPTSEDVSDAVRRYVAREVAVLKSRHDGDEAKLRADIGEAAFGMVPDPQSLTIKASSIHPLDGQRYAATVTIDGNLGAETVLLSLAPEDNVWTVVDKSWKVIAARQP
jgi:hypothetical protein